MGLSEPRVVFGVHSITPYNRTTGLPFGIAKVVGSAALELSGEFEDLFGGSNKFAWASEQKTLSAELTATLKSYEDWMFELFLGKSVTTVAAETGGNASALTNKKGTTTVSATVGIASVGVKTSSEADLKFGKYVVKVVSATTVDVYAVTDVDNGNGTAFEYQDNLLKITVSAITITTGAAADIPNTGLELTGGSGTIAMVADDTATFEVRPIHEGGFTVSIGASANTFPVFGSVMLAAKRSNNSLFEIDAVKCNGFGMPLNLEESVFSIAEVTIKCLYDSVLDKVFDIRSIDSQA